MSPDAVLGVLENDIVKPFFYLIFALAAIYFVWGVFLFVKNSDDPSAQETGKRHMIYGIVGIAIMLAVEGIIDLIRNTVN